MTLVKSASLLAAAALLFAGACATTRTYDFGNVATLQPEEIASLEVPPELQLFRINQENVSSIYSYIGGGKTSIHLPPGDYIVRLRYRDIWPIGADDHDVVQSEPIELAFNAAPGLSYQISYPKPDTYESAKKFAEHPAITVVDVSSRMMVSETVRDTNSGIRKTENRLRLSPPSAIPTPEAKGDMKSMQDWWEKASPEERAEFQRWIWQKPSGK
jgi:uncharacterized protein YccT (UPF0319 family)